MTTDPTEREAYVQGLRDLAAFLEARTELPVPSSGVTVNLFASHFNSEDPKAGLAELARQLGSFRKESFGNWLALVRDFGPMRSA